MYYDIIKNLEIIFMILKSKIIFLDQIIFDEIYWI